MLLTLSKSCGGSDGDAVDGGVLSERGEGDDTSVGLQQAVVPLDAGALHPDVDVLAAADQHAPCWQNADRCVRVRKIQSQVQFCCESN